MLPENSNSKIIPMLIFMWTWIHLNDIQLWHTYLSVCCQIRMDFSGFHHMSSFTLQNAMLTTMPICKSICLVCITDICRSYDALHGCLKHLTGWCNHIRVMSQIWYNSASLYHSDFLSLQNFGDCGDCWQHCINWLCGLRINTLRLRQTGGHFAEDSFKWVFLNENI